MAVTRISVATTRRGAATRAERVQLLATMSITRQGQPGTSSTLERLQASQDAAITALTWVPGTSSLWTANAPPWVDAKKAQRKSSGSRKISAGIHRTAF